MIRHGCSHNIFLIIWVLAKCMALLLLTGIIVAGIPVRFQPNTEKPNYLGDYRSKSPEGVYERAVVVSDAPYCAPIGKEILKKNGSAMDAAIAVLLCMGVVIPESMGLGGGCVITYYDSAMNKSTVIDGREVAPLRATESMFNGTKDASVTGPLAIAVPGELKAYWEAHKRFGRLPWRELFEGAIRVSEEGFQVHHHLENSLNSTSERVKNSDLRKIFVNPKTGELYKKGEILKRPDLAKTFRRLANATAEIFYSGSIAEELLTELKLAGAIITKKDFLDYNVKVTESLQTRIDDIILHSAPLPAGGPLLSFIMKTMSRLKKKYQDAHCNEDEAVNFYHMLIEVFKHASAQRAFLGDPLFDNVTATLNDLMSDTFIGDVITRINPKKTFSPGYYGSLASAESHGTAHMTVIDSEGNAVSASSTINTYFASKILSNSTGIIFNNEMDDFSSPNVLNQYGVKPGKFNHISPQKRPLSSMCPSVVTNAVSGEVKLVIGGAGGTKITTGTALVAIRNLFFGESLKTAIDSARLHHQLYPNTVVYDHHFPRSLRKRLEEFGHRLLPLKGRGSVIVAAAKMQDGCLHGAFDYRKGGSVDGL